MEVWSEQTGILARLALSNLSLFELDSSFVRTKYIRIITHNN
jgi:hypothetical protein